MIHLVYPHRNTTSAPDVIGKKIFEHFSKWHDVTLHDIDRTYKITPEKGDILIGHSHPLKNTVFRRSLPAPEWARKILLQPFNHDWGQVGYIDEFIDNCDKFLAITGNYWFANLRNSPMARWAPKMVHVDLAVSQTDFPFIKQSFSKPGMRKFLYIGNDHPGKNVDYLYDIYQHSKSQIDWIGRGSKRNSFGPIAFLDLGSDHGRNFVTAYDFLITVGSADANPTTILEAMSWGLIPMCTVTSGYDNELGIVRIPNKDTDLACRVIDEWQFAEEDRLREIQQHNINRVNEHFNWERFCSQVEKEILARDSIAISGAQSLVSAHQGIPSNFHGSYFVLYLRLFFKNILYRMEKISPVFSPRGKFVSSFRNFFKF